MEERSLHMPDEGILKDLVLSCYGNLNALDAMTLPKKLDLGNIGFEAANVLKHTYQDRMRGEHGNGFYTLDGRRLFTLGEPVRGVFEVCVPVDPRLKRLLIVHTHKDIDTPFNCGMGDLVNLFLPADDPYSVVGTMLPTKTVTVLLLRTDRTPIVKKAEASWMTLYYQLLEYSNVQEESDLIRKNGYEGLAAISHKRMYGLTRAAVDYHLALYAGNPRENVVYRAS